MVVSEEEDELQLLQMERRGARVNGDGDGYGGRRNQRERERVLGTEQLNHFFKPLFVTSFGNVFSSIGSQLVTYCCTYGTLSNRYKVRVCGCYVVSFSILLQRLPIRFTQQNLCCISKFTMKHLRKLGFKSDLPNFGYANRKCILMILVGYIRPPNSVHYLSV